MRTKFILIIYIFVSLSACGNSGSGDDSVMKSIFDQDKTAEWPICPTLTFDNQISWPPQETGARRSAFQLALNIISSFEGHDGWSSISNDFDGMGLSLGLFNQPLGVGSLQPLLLEMRDRHNSVMSSKFSAAHFSALLSMLRAWETGPTAAVTKGPLLSPLDAYGETEADAPRLSSVEPLLSKNSASASWARSTLYIDGGTTFKADWKQELQNLASASQYVSIQIKAALDSHEYALSLYNTIGILNVRSYLMMFDFVVQNGGLYNTDISQYQAWYKQNPNATEKQRLYKILELRLRHVRPQYVEDVRRRKTAIVEGTGYVHGSNRQLESEYCYNSTWSF